MHSLDALEPTPRICHCARPACPESRGETRRDQSGPILSSPRPSHHLSSRAKRPDFLFRAAFWRVGLRSAVSVRILHPGCFYRGAPCASPGWRDRSFAFLCALCVLCEILSPSLLPCLFAYFLLFLAFLCDRRLPRPGRGVTVPLRFSLGFAVSCQLSASLRLHPHRPPRRRRFPRRIHNLRYDHVRLQ